MNQLQASTFCLTAALRLEYKDIDLAGAGSSHRATTSETCHISSTGLVVTELFKADKKIQKNSRQRIKSLTLLIRRWRRRTTMETKPSSRSKRVGEELGAVAGNGLLDRRAFLRGGAAFAAAMTGYTFVQSAAAEPLADDPWSKVPGNLVPAYGVPSRFEKNVVRTLSNPKGEPRTQHGRTPHHLLNGTITPNGLHFVISHAGDADIDPE